MELSKQEIKLLEANRDYRLGEIQTTLEAKEKSSLVKKLLEVIGKEEGLTYKQAYYAIGCAKQMLKIESNFGQINKIDIVEKDEGEEK